MQVEKNIPLDQEIKRVIPSQILQAIESQELDRAFQECLAAWEDATPDELTQTEIFIEELCDHFRRVIIDVDDPAECETITALFYIQVRVQWVLLNTQSGYQIHVGVYNHALFCRSGLLTALLTALETVLLPRDVERINAFIAEPLTLPTAAE